MRHSSTISLCLRGVQEGSRNGEGSQAGSGLAIILASLSQSEEKEGMSRQC